MNDPGFTSPRIASFVPVPGHQAAIIRQVLVQFATLMDIRTVQVRDNWSMATDANVPQWQDRVLSVAVLNPDDGQPTRAVVSLRIPDIINGHSFTLTAGPNIKDLYGTSLGGVASASYQAPWGAIIDGGDFTSPQPLRLDGGTFPTDLQKYTVDGGTF